MMPWEIINKKNKENKENQNILSISCFGNPNDATRILNKDFLISDPDLLQKTEQKINNGELWAKIIFKNIKWICRFKWLDDGYTFLIERSTIKFVHDGQTPESSSRVKADTDELIKFLQDKNNHFVCKEGSKMTDIEIRLE